MTIKKMIICSSVLIAVAFITLIMLFITMGKSVNEINETQKNFYESLMIADELRESSRELTSAVRKFAVTGDECYADEYMDVILTRTGEKPRPDNRAIAPGETVPLNDLMIQSRLTEQELKLLQQSFELSDKLALLEIEAINAVRGLFADGEGNFTVKGEPDREFAIGLIFSTEYNDEVDLIMKPFTLFYQMLNARLNNAVAAAQADYDRSLHTAWIILFLTVCLFAALLILIGLVIVRPILLCEKFVKQIIGGRLDAGLTYTSGNEIGTLASALRLMVQSILERMDLEERSRRFDTVISSVDAGVLIKDENGLITDWNTGAEKILGYTREEIIGKTTKYFSPESLHYIIDETLEKLKRGGHVAYSEDTRIHKDGREVNCPASCTPLFSDGGEFKGAVIIFHDGTEKKLADQNIRRLAAILAIADAGIIVKDENGIIKDWNIGAENILGYTPEEMIGQTVHRYVPEEYREGVDIIDARLAMGEHITHLETIRRHRDGHLVNCSTSYTPIFDENKNFAGAAAIFHDITKEKLAVEKVRSLAAIVAIADAGIIVKDKNGVVNEWNIGAENILGYKPEEVIGNTTHYYAPEKSWASIDESEARLAKGEHIVHVEVLRKHKDGRLIDCSASYTPIFGDNKTFMGSVAIFHDISDKKQIESALKDALSETREKHQTIISSMEYARKIQKSLLPKEYAFQKAFEDYAVIWKPRDIVGGDIYWIKNFSDGAVLCACDCTGHGTPGALLTMLMVSAFESAINESNYKDTAQIIWELDQRLVSVFNVNSDGGTKNRLAEVKDGCDVAVLFIANDGRVIISSGNIHVFICDGKKVTRIKGQKIFVGEGGLESKDDIQTVEIPANPENKFYIGSDGLYDQIGGETNIPFGYNTFKRIILENHNCGQESIRDMIWEAFESYRGSQPRRDDVGLITFKKNCTYPNKTDEINISL